MDKSIIDVKLTPLKQIATSGGPVLHMLRADSPLFSGFGEVYFSEVLPGAVKGWKRHRQMTQNFAVPVGRVKFVLYDDRPGSPSCGRLVEYVLGRPDAYNLLTVPPLIWYGFACLGQVSGLIANCASFPHLPEESERLALDSSLIPYAWV